MSIHKQAEALGYRVTGKLALVDDWVESDFPRIVCQQYKDEAGLVILARRGRIVLVHQEEA